MSDNQFYIKKLLHGAGFSVLNLVLGLTLGLILSPYLVRTLGDRHFGIYILAGTFTSWFSLLDLGLNLAVSRFITLHYSKNELDECRVISNTSLFLYIILGMLGLLISFVIGAGAVLFRPDIEDVNLFSVVIIIFGFAFMAQLSMNTFSGTLHGVLRSDIGELCGFAFRALGAVQTFCILYFGGRLIHLALGNMVLVFINLFVLYWLAKKAFPQLVVSPRYFRKAEIRSLIGYSVYTLIRNIGSVLILRTSTLVLATFVSLAAVAHYQVVACTLTYNFMSLMLAMTSWLTSWLTLLHGRNEYETLLKTMQLGYKFSVYMASFIAFGLIVWGKAFIIRWMGPAYLDAYPALVVNTLYFWVMLSQTVNSRYLFAIAQHRYLAITILFEGILNLVIGLMLVKGHGMIGVAAGLAIAGMITNGIVVPLVVCRFLKFRPFDYYAKFLSMSIVALIALVPPFFVAQRWLLPSYPALLSVALASALLYFPVVYLVGLNSEDRRKILSLLVGNKAGNAEGESLT